eukprot:SAG22_NODE_2349_length_2681_cov_20.618900_4_plen_123_part_00
MVRKKAQPVRGREHPEDRLRPQHSQLTRSPKRRPTGASGRANFLWKYFRNSTGGATHTMHVGSESFQPLLFMKNVKKKDFVASPSMIAEMEAFYQQEARSETDGDRHSEEGCEEEKKEGRQR